MPRKNKLTDEQRAFVVREIAGFSTPSQIAAMVKEEFGVEIGRSAVEFYDPSKNKKLSKRWREHHDAMRKVWREKMEDMIPLANKFVRLRELAAMVGRLGKNELGKAQILEQIAKEVGNVHTNRREHTGANGKPLQFEDVSAMTPEQISQELKALTAEPAAKAFLLGLMGNEEAAPIPAPQAQETKNGTKAKGR